jgi:hypothetical protein
MDDQEHTAKLILKDLKLVKVVKVNGKRAKPLGKGKPPPGQITGIATIVLVTVQDCEPQGRCWAYYNGNWYNYC